MHILCRACDGFTVMCNRIFSPAADGVLGVEDWWSIEIEEVVVSPAAAGWLGGHRSRRSGRLPRSCCMAGGASMLKKKWSFPPQLLSCWGAGVGGGGRVEPH